MQRTRFEVFQPDKPLGARPRRVPLGLTQVLDDIAKADTFPPLRSNIRSLAQPGFGRRPPGAGPAVIIVTLLPAGHALSR